MYFYRKIRKVKDMLEEVFRYEIENLNEEVSFEERVVVCLEVGRWRGLGEDGDISIMI